METPAARVFGTTRSVRVVYARFTGRLPAPPLHAGGGGGGGGDETRKRHFYYPRDIST